MLQRWACVRRENSRNRPIWIAARDRHADDRDPVEEVNGSTGVAARNGRGTRKGPHGTVRPPVRISGDILLDYPDTLGPFIGAQLHYFVGAVAFRYMDRLPC